jgi:hypothetical protein
VPLVRAAQAILLRRMTQGDRLKVTFRPLDTVNRINRVSTCASKQAASDDRIGKGLPTDPQAG